MNPPSASHSRTSSTHASAAAASLRPRTKRLISGLDELSVDDYSGSAVVSPNVTPLESPFFSRVPSPIPSKHPSRSSSTNPRYRDTPGEPGGDSATSLSGLWGKSWTSLQGLASNVLGSDASVELVKDKLPQRIRKPTQPASTFGSGSKIWGPAGQDVTQPGGGSKDERMATVRAKKRQEMLRNNSGLGTDTKRRTSDDFDSASAPPEDQSQQEILVYIHHVAPEDTLPGISIKFNCPLPTMKKANRLWSNDGIQFRKIIVIPVDVCNVKGRRVASPNKEEPDILSGDGTEDPGAIAQAVDRYTSSQGQDDLTESTLVTGRTPAPSSFKATNEPPWKHDSWILLSSHSDPIEIARLSRQDLGYFPRTRRKSVAYSDVETPRGSASFDIPRPSITISQPSNEHIGQNRRRRSSSTSRFASQMIGPGGVGTLVGKGPSAPGPAEDRLSRVFSKHLPGLVPSITSTLQMLPGESTNISPAPPSGSRQLLSSSVSSSTTDHGGYSRTSHEDHHRSGASTPVLGLGDVGSAIEGWARKLAKTAAKAMEPPSPGQQMGRATGIRSGHGDLIELSDAYEIDEDDEARGRPVGSSAIEDRGFGVRERAFGNGKSKGV